MRSALDPDPGGEEGGGGEGNASGGSLGRTGQGDDVFVDWEAVVTCAAAEGAQ